MKKHSPIVAKTVLTMKNKEGGITLPGTKTYYIVTVIETVWYWWRNRLIIQWNKKENPERDQHKYAQLF